MKEKNRERMSKKNAAKKIERLCQDAASMNHF
jgi:hypothetical protein